jgi:hypothetical protein
VAAASRGVAAGESPGSVSTAGGTGGAAVDEPPLPSGPLTSDPPPLPPDPVPLPDPLPAPPVVLVGSAVGGTCAVRVGGGTGGTDESPVDGVVDGAAVGGVVVDSVGRVALALGEADGFGVGVVFGGAGVVCRAAGRASRVTGRWGSDSRIGRALGVVADGVGGGAGGGVGRTAASVLSFPPRSGSGRIALELTGPPAKLTLISPPYSMHRPPNA